MSYQVLARKWRPKNFHELVGQDHVRKALVSALDNDRLHHAYLFTGTRGVGKTTIARIIAKCLNCETGVTSRPCGECTSCREIDEGRFVDLIEVDAASRTKVEDTRELLDNVQYAPSRGRYKVYLIDEVHMLSTHSFNALLKTLEEPPPHVKFLLATTDPQKLPVTVLSRCLQFNLKNMPPERVVEHLSHVLGDEQISFEEPALWQLGRAADGSMRDALSLTDQAIAYGQGQITAALVSEMLGLVDHRHVAALIDHLINRDARALLNEVVQLSEQAADFETILSDMALYLHRMAIAHVLPDAVDNAQGDREQVLAQAARLTAEDVQLYYQIAIKSQQDLPLAPDARTGFEMALIRMIAFAPQGVPSEGGNPLPSQSAPLPGQSVPVSTAQAAGAAHAITADADDPAKKKVAEPAQPEPQAEPVAQPAAPTVAPEPEPEPNPAPQPEAPVATAEPEIARPQRVSFQPPTRQAAAENRAAEPAQDAAHTVQNARAALGGGLRTVKFPSATAQKISASGQSAGTAPGPAPVQPEAVVAAPQAPADIPPWEEQPVAAEPAAVQSEPAPAPQAPQTQAAPQPEPAPEYQPVPPVAQPSDVMAPEPMAADDSYQAYARQMAQAESAPVDVQYQQMMPENVPHQPQPAPLLRDSKLPEAQAAGISPMVGPCPASLNSNQDWLEAFAHLPLRGLDRSLAKNAALTGREGNHLIFTLKSVTENFLTPEREANWLQAVRQLFDESLTLEISGFNTDLDTPEEYEIALQQQRQQQAQTLFAQDPMVNGLCQQFGGRIDTGSVEPLV